MVGMIWDTGLLLYIVSPSLFLPVQILLLGYMYITVMWTCCICVRQVTPYSFVWTALITHARAQITQALGVDLNAGPSSASGKMVKYVFPTCLTVSS